MVPQVAPLVRPSAAGRYFSALLGIFALSGCAALMYEVVWYQSLQLAIGSTTVSMAFLLAAWMGGLSLGAAIAPRIARQMREGYGLRLYAAIELGAAVLGVCVTAAIPLVSGVYFAGAAHGFPNMLLRGVVSALCLLPPTLLMGASLPVMARVLAPDADSSRRLGLLYAANTTGAVAGCLLAGFWLLRIYDVTVATLAAAALNSVAALAALALRVQPDEEARNEAHSREDARPEVARADRAVLISIALSGAVALGAEIVWTRLLGMLLLGTVYVFAIILAVFLAGIAIGSSAAAKMLRRVQARTALGVTQILLAPAIAWTAFAITRVLPWWHDDWLDTQNAWRLYGLDLERVLIAILPAAILFGASFPFACRALAKREEDDPQATASKVYTANTLGAIAGALLIALWVIPAFGTRHAQQALVAGSLVSAGVALMRRSFRPVHGFAMAAAALCLLLVPETPADLIAYGRFMALNAGYSTVLYKGEGRNSSLAITQWANGTTYINVNGHVEATTEPYDMKLQRMVGHLPALLHPNPKSVLGIGFGAGVSAGTFTRYPGIEQITICEIEPLIPPASTRYFPNENYSVMTNPRTHIEFDDARHFLLTTTRKFDVIASDPLDVFIKGTAALYSKEYFEAVKRRLNPGGMFSLYVPLYETSEDTIRGELATFFAAFPNGTVWANTRDGQGYDMVFLGSLEPLKINVDEIEARLLRPDYGPVAQSLAEVGVGSGYQLFATYSGNANDLAPWTRGAEINRDSNLRLSYLAGWGVNSKLADDLYRRMISYRKKQAAPFTGTQESVGRVLSMME